MAEILGATVDGMLATGIAAVTTGVALHYALPRLRRLLLRTDKFPLRSDADLYLNREYAKPEPTRTKSAA